MEWAAGWLGGGAAVQGDSRTEVVYSGKKLRINDER